MSRPFLKIPSDSNLKWVSVKNLYDRIYKIDTMYDEFFNSTKFEFLLTKEKMQHNHSRFFDTKLVKDRIVTEIINPLIQHVQAST